MAKVKQLAPEAVGTVGQAIRRRRIALGLSQQQLADKIGVRQDTISNFETGSSPVRADDLPALARALHMSPASFFAREVDDDGRFTVTPETINELSGDELTLVHDVLWRKLPLYNKRITTILMLALWTTEVAGENTHERIRFYREDGRPSD